jgi:hypothetical protein
MFRTLLFRNGSQTANSAAANALFNSSPAEILALIDIAWRVRDDTRKSGVVKQQFESVSPVPLVPESALLAKYQLNDPAPMPPGPGGGSIYPLWVYPHALESFCLENTRIVEIFRRVLGHFLYGEQLAVPPDRSSPSPDTDINGWLRVTETVFFGHGYTPSPFTVTSAIRSNADLVRRNLYYRMFGADLLHPHTEGGTVEVMKPAASNRDFFPTLERLLAEVWRGLVNAKNTSGRRDTDDAAIATLATRLHDTMQDRRLGGNLHMAVAWNSPIVKALKAEADHPADRLSRIGERVGLKAHVHSAAYIQMGPLTSGVMEAIERGLFNESDKAPFLYMPTLAGPLAMSDTMNQLITLYMRATGRDIKAAAVTVSQRA